MEIKVHFSVSGTFSKGLLFWVVSGDRQTKNYVSDTNECVALVASGVVSITVYDRSTFCVVGTTLVCIQEEAVANNNSVTRTLVRNPNDTRKSQCTMQCTVESPHGIDKEFVVNATHKCGTETDVTWPVDVCINHGVPTLRPVELSGEDCAHLAERWSSYVRFAYLISHGAPEKASDETLFAVSLGVIGGCYHLEDEDDRGVAGLTQCRGDDCDGMAMSSSFFWNLMVTNQKMVVPRVKGRAERRLLMWALRRYPVSLLVFGMSASPDNQKKIFYHAWSVCEARPATMYKPYSKLNSDEQKALKVLGVTEASWAGGTHIPNRQTIKWRPGENTPTHKALEALGWNIDMWNIQTKIHIESTSALAFGDAGTIPSDQVTAHQAHCRKHVPFRKKDVKLLFSRIRRAPDKFEAYINLSELRGPFFRHRWSTAIPYREWLESDDMYPRADVSCCSGEAGDVRERLAPVILRTKEESIGLERPTASNGVFPRLSPADAPCVITSWSAKRPPKPTKKWSPHPINVDYYVPWCVWVLKRADFEDVASS